MTDEIATTELGPDDVVTHAERRGVGERAVAEAERRGQATAADLILQYDATAQLHRRRAAKATDPDRAAEHSRRAHWYAARAACLAARRPYPRELCTPLDHAKRLDAIRHRLVELLELLEDVAPEDVEAFVGLVHLPLEGAAVEALRDVRDPMFFASLAGAGDALATALGVDPSYRDLYRPYDMPPPLGVDDLDGEASL